MTPVPLGTPVQDPGGLITSLERRRSSWSRTDAIDPKPTVIKAQANGRVGWIPVLRRDRRQRRGCADSGRLRDEV